MFRVEQNVPDVYREQSRDFQLFSRLYDLVFQASRFSIDSMEQISDTRRCQDTLLPLIATKVGFFTDIKLTTDAHRRVLCAFPYIINHKGSIEGLKLTINLLSFLMNTKIEILEFKEDRSRLTLKFEYSSPDFELLKDIIEYIRPTGCIIDFLIELKMSVKESVAANISSSITEPSISYGVIQNKVDYNNSSVGFTEIVSAEQHNNIKEGATIE